MPFAASLERFFQTNLPFRVSGGAYDAILFEAKEAPLTDLYAAVGRAHKAGFIELSFKLSVLVHELEPSSTNALKGARMALLSRNYEAALRFAEVSLESDPSLVAAVEVAAAAARDSRQWQLAAEYYGALCRQRPTQSAWSNLGRMLLNGGRYVEAAEALRRGVELEPSDVSCALGLARAELKIDPLSEGFDTSIQYLARASLNSALQWARRLEKQNKRLEAGYVLKGVERGCGTSLSFQDVKRRFVSRCLGRYQVLVKQGDETGALALLDMCHTIDPKLRAALSRAERK